MARIWAHTPICRQISLSSSSLAVGGVLAKRNLSSSPRARASAAAIPPAGTGRECRSFPAVAAFTNRHHPFEGISPVSVGLLRGMARLHVSTSKATAGSEVEVGSGAKSQNREILVQHILVKEDQGELLTELERQVVEEDLDLSDLAEEYSQCPSKSGGGMIGWIRPGQTDPAFEEVAFNAPLNKLVRVKTKHGLHLLQVLNERVPRFLAQLQVEEFHQRMQDPTFFDEAQLIDVREPDEISTASIRGFQAYPLSQFGQWAPRILDDLDPDKDTFVLCHHGMRSMQASSWLQSQGFRRLYNIAGGIHAYSKNVDRTIPTY